MHIDCPHCQNPIDIVVEQPTDAITCPSCGSSFSLFDPGKTTPFREQQIRAIGRFQLIEHLGSGHFGDVWLARDSTLEREVALKVPRREHLDRDDIEMFLREARAAARLQHPNIVQLHEVGKAGDLVFIVSEVIRGMNLQEWLTGHPLGTTEAAKLCATLAAALHHAHQAGVVHRDLKPANVLMDHDGQPHLTDFGLAKRDGAEITMTVDGRIMGTPAYMSPEQARGDAHDADCRSDVYSLGVVLFEMLTGQRPFSGKSKLMLVQQVLHEEPPLPRTLKKSIPRDLETVCLKALAKDPARRYQTAQEMHDDLGRFVEGRPIVARRVRRVERTWRWAKRNPLAAALATTLSVLMIAFVGLVWLGIAADRRPGLRRVRFSTRPAGAHVVFVPLDYHSGDPIGDQAVRPVQVTPLEAELRPGRYLVVAVVDGHGFHEVYRTVPAPDEEKAGGTQRFCRWTIGDHGEVELPEITNIPRAEDVTSGMTRFRGGRFEMGIADDEVAPAHPRDVADFWLATTEVTVGEYKSVLNGLPDGSATLEPSRDDSFPVTLISYPRALEYAERAGLRLPTEAEYEYAATGGGKFQFPWGNDPAAVESWKPAPVRNPGIDQTPTQPPVFGLFSNATEWTDSILIQYPGAFPLDAELKQKLRHFRVVRGGPRPADKQLKVQESTHLDARDRRCVDQDEQSPGLGFRCARSAAPRFFKRP